MDRKGDLKNTSKGSLIFKSYGYYDNPYYFGNGASKFKYSAADYGPCPMDCFPEDKECMADAESRKKSHEIASLVLTIVLIFLGILAIFLTCFFTRCCYIREGCICKKCAS
jgi:hypothetical protein